MRAAPVHAQDFLILTGLKEDWKTVYAMDAGSYKQHRKNACKTEGDDSGQDDLKRITYMKSRTLLMIFEMITMEGARIKDVLTLQVGNIHQRS